jgi:hypothetical protein
LSSELLGNTLRGVFAVYFVALDLGVAEGFRTEWDAFDPDGVAAASWVRRFSQ